MKLSLEDAEKFPAKTAVLEDGTIGFGITVRQHGLITAEVLRNLVELMHFPLKEQLLPDGLVGVAGEHDIGKINPLFLEKLINHTDLNNVSEHWIELAKTLPGLTEAMHPSVSFSVLLHLGAKKICAETVEAHHGVTGGFKPPLESPEVGGREWIEARDAVAKNILKTLNLEGFPEACKDKKVKKHQKEVWAGLVMIADWISSRQETPIPEGTEKEVARKLLKEAGFHELKIRTSDFKACFGFNPRLEQAVFMELYRGPGVYVLEAPTGCGKTEAALGLAFKAIENGDASGIYFALPTQLTSNKIHERLEEALVNFLESSSDVQLIHSGAYLQNMKKMLLGKEGAPGETFFTGTKRALIAPFGAGTVDQALLCLLESNKYHSLRKAGLLGKVIILDEIHSYDAYTSSLVSKLISTIEDLGGTVIILSATLTDSSRQGLLRLEERIHSNKDIILTSRVNGEVSCTELDSARGSQKIVHVKLEDGADAETKSLEEVLGRVQRGEQVLWIENTVDAAQYVYQFFKKNNVSCGLLHSRFRVIDREEIEKKWIGVFGREGKEKRKESGHVLIGTQILEQSLDIDADFIVTRLAPIDLLIQRIGRLWRHRDNERPKGCCVPEVTIIAAPERSFKQKDEDSIQNVFGISGKVYQPYILLRTLKTIRARLAKNNELDLPKEVRFLMEDTYSDREEVSDSEAQELCHEFETHRKKLEDAAAGRQSQVGLDPCASTRWIEYESQPLLIIREEELKRVPKDRMAMALWLESRVVKSPIPVKVAPLHESSEILDVLREFVKKSRKFRNMPALYLKNEHLEDVLENVEKLYYSTDEGLAFEKK